MDKKYFATNDIYYVNRHLQDLNPLFNGEERCYPGHSFGPAVRKYTLIHYIISGTGTIKKAEGEYRAGAGDAFLILPEEIVTYTSDVETPWHYTWIAFDGALSARFSELPAVLHNFPGSLLRELLEAPDRGMREYHAAAVLMRLYAELFAEEKPRNHYVRRVQDYIRAQYMNPLRVETIAEQMNLDRRYLSRLFKQKTGNSIQEFLIAVRMEEAQRLLLVGHPVETVAQLCGYEDPCNFSKMFKRRYGVSPQFWRRSQHG